MNFLDFAAGQQMANFSNQRALDDAIADWENYSNKLKGKLQKSEQEYAASEARWAGARQLWRQAKAELARLDPNNPLLREEVRKQIVGPAMVNRYAELGYVYDVDSGMARKRG